MARTATAQVWTRHIRGADLKYNDETKARNAHRFSRGATHIKSESSLSEDVKKGIDTLFYVTFPSLSPVHCRVIIREMLAFLQACIEDPKTVQVLSGIQQGRALPACTYFLDWVATQVNDTYELRRAVVALERAMKDNNHHISPGSFASSD